jgi:Holliday junction resolvase-like predicted endonuclease
VDGSGGRTEHQRSGDAAEDAVVRHLEAGGWQILGRNVHAGRSELDIVAVDPGPPARLVVVEVRWRRSPAFGLPEETFDYRKRANLRRGLGLLLEAGSVPDGGALPNLPVAVDLVVCEPAACGAMRLRHHRDALA